MHILALSPFHGGSHQSFLTGWMAHSRHEFTVESLPAYKWKWRMRHSAITLATRANDRLREQPFDVLFCTDMLNLAEFLGLASPRLREIPAVVYFHENQLTYPVRNADERDLHFAFTNLTSALAADHVWFNSGFHRDQFLAALPDWLQRMPDYQPIEAVEAIRGKSAVMPPGIDSFPARTPSRPQPLHIVWASRWEHDKGPEDFFSAIERLDQQGLEFRLSVVGESFSQVPDCFPAAQKQYRDRILNWGFLPSQDDYRQLLLNADVIVSTAKHEFFGIAIAEAVAAGCYPVVPDRLAYPEVLPGSDDFFYDGTVEGLAFTLKTLIGRVDHLWGCDPGRGRKLVERYTWSRTAKRMDEALPKRG